MPNQGLIKAGGVKTGPRLDLLLPGLVQVIIQVIKLDLYPGALQKVPGGKSTSP